MSKKAVTEFSSPNETIDSAHGRIPYRKWCEKERDRINAHGGDRVKIVKRADGFIALSR